MCKDLHHEQRSIILPASVLDALKDMSPGALKVFIYLCSYYQGQPFAVSIPTITDSIGIQPRSVISALDILVKHQLITRIPGSGSQPNQYGILLPKRQETVALPGLRQATPPAATTPRPATTPIIPSPSTKSRQATAASPTPTQANILELIDTCYRRINAQEFAQVKQAYPDEVVLREKLEKFKNTGVDPAMDLSFFIRALTQFA
jgi:hypothetical protein